MSVRQILHRLRFASCLLFAGFFPAVILVADDQPAVENERPNILWLTTEDIGPQLGCYGDAVADTPNLDEFARRSLLYKTAWSNYPVCAPARTTIISGRYACADGAGNMRSSAPLPEGMNAFPVYLREAGYYCTNSSKTDYNYNNLQDIWDQSSGDAHWRNRDEGQPFFAVFNHTGTHESQIRKRPHDAVTDPASVVLPPYWPDTPEVRTDWAQYYDNLSRMDNWFARKLLELEEAGLAESTIVIFFGDHGSGMPRHKRYAGDSGLRVPFIVHVPEKFRDLMPDDYERGGTSDRLVSFVDLAPTMLSLAGIEPKEFMQGNSFAGEYESAPPEYMFGFRERMDERPDISHLIRDKKYIYVRNYRTDVVAGQFLDYQQQTPATSTWYRMFVNGDLNETQSQFWSARPAEQLFDLDADPHEVNNLASQQLLSGIRTELAWQQRKHAIQIGAQTLIPEPCQWQRFGSDRTRRADPLLLEAVLDLAELASIIPDDMTATRYVEGMRLNEFSDSAPIRYWTAKAIASEFFTDEESYGPEQIADRLSNDVSPCVAIAALKHLILTYESNRTERCDRLIELADMTATDFYSAVYAINALEAVREHLSEDQLQTIRQLPPMPENIKRGNNYVERLISRFKEDNGRP